MELLGHTLEFVGVIMIAYMAIRVHSRVRVEQKVDKKVVSEMNRERIVGVIGIIFIILGYLLQVPSKL